MKIFQFHIVLFILTLLVGESVYGQSAQQLACQQNAQDACSNPGFQLTPSGGNALPGGLNVSNPQSNPAGINTGCLLSNGPSGNWMILTVGSSGMLGFSFGAAGSAYPQSGFYDWALWPYNSNSCANIFNNTLPPVACNWNATTVGGTGMGNPPPGASTGNFQPSIPAQAGQQFLLLLSNWSGVTTSVSIANNGSAALQCNPLLLPSVIRCPSQQAVITATWSANLTNKIYTITPSMPLNANTYTVQQSPTFIVSPPATQVYTVFAAGYDSNLSSVVTTSNTFTVTISPTTTMDIVASPNPTTMPGIAGNVCYNSKASLTALSPGTTFTLTGPGNFVSFSSIPIMNTPSLTTNSSFTIGVTLFSGCTATGAVNVNVAPNHTISVNTVTNVCLNGNVTLQASMPTATAYSWVGPNSYAATGANPSISNISLLGGGIYMVSSNINYNNISCPRTATTQVNVVQTYPVSGSASPNDTLCQGQNLNLTANTTGTASYFWQGPNNFNVYSQSTGVSNVLQANAGIYTVSALFNNGFLTCARSNTIRAWVIATSFPTVTIPANVCQNSDVTMSVTALTASAIPVSYQWSGPGGYSSNLQTLSFSNVQPSNAGQYYAYARFNIGGAVTCTTQTIRQLNIVTVNNITVIPPIPVCSPDNAFLYSSALASTGYTWTGPNSFVSYQNNAVVFSPSVSASGVYTIQSSFGSGALTCYNTNTVELTVNPVLRFQLAQNPEPRCYGDTIRVEGPVGATSYTWTSSTGYTSNNRNLVLGNVQPENSGVYMLSVSLGSCTWADNTSIRILDRISLNNAILPKNMTLCKEGPSVYFTAGAIGGSENYAFTWTPLDNLSSPTGSVVVANPKATGVYNVTGYDIACPNYSLTHSFSVTVKSAPKPELNLEKYEGCKPFCLSYNPKIEKKQNAIVFYEFIDEATGTSRKFQSDSASNYSLDRCISDAGSYKVKVTTTILTEEGLACTETFDQTQPITVYPGPGSNIVWTPEKPTLTDNVVTFNAVSQQQAEIMSWDFGGIANDTALVITPQKTFETPGKYGIMLITKTTDWGCYDTIVKYIEVVEDFNVFIPNSFTPNGDHLNDVFQIKGSSIKIEGFSMEIFDRWGASMFFTTDPQKGWDGTAKNGKSAGEGAYIYRVTLTSSNKEGRKEYMGSFFLVK